MTLIDRDEMWSRDSARHRLGVPLDVRLAYVQLGAGRINDIDSDVRQVVDALLAHEDIHVVLGESLLGDRLEINMDRVHVIRDYPNALFYNAFDVSVQAGGYNSFHEMRLQGIPTLFLPNMNTGMDDQLSRCIIAGQEGWGIIHNNKSDIEESIMKLVQHQSLIEKFESNGSEVLAEYLFEDVK